MRQALLVVTALAVVALVARARPSEAGELPVANLVVSDGGSCATAVFGFSKKYELQGPDAGAWIAVDGRTNCPPGYPCIQLPPGVLLPTTTRRPADGGQSRITACCLSGVTACAVSVFELEGNEGL